MSLRQAARIWRLERENAKKQQHIDTLTARLRRMHNDVELLAACLPRDRRQFALSLVRDQHRIEALDETEEVGG